VARDEATQLQLMTLLVAGYEGQVVWVTAKIATTWGVNTETYDATCTVSCDQFIPKAATSSIDLRIKCNFPTVAIDQPQLAPPFSQLGTTA